MIKKIQFGMLVLMFLISTQSFAFSPVNKPKYFFVGPDSEYKTISSALAKMEKGDICMISEGIYREQINVQQDSITLRGESQVIITGCDDAGEMQSCMINGHKGLKKVFGVPVYDVFLNEQYLIPARFPNKTFAMTSNEDWEETFIGPSGKIDFHEHAQKMFPSLADGYYVGVHGNFEASNGKLSSWCSITLPIQGLGEHDSILVNAEEASSGFMGKFGQGMGLGYIIGAKAALDAPGEWYSDGKQILLIPLSGKIDGYELRLRLYGAVVTGNGVKIENIRFKAASVRIEGNNVSLLKCAFEYISPFQHNKNDVPENKMGQSLVSSWGDPQNGTAGVFVKGNGFVAKNCRFSKSWWCGMMIRGNNALVENCLFEDMNWMAKRSAALFSWGDGNIVRFCTFRNLGGAGIEGGNAHWVEQYAKNNTWEYNYIEDVSKLIVDQGFFYVNHQSGANPEAGSIWRYNVGKTSRGPIKGNWKRTTVGYYVDNSSSGYRIHNNIAIDANDAIRYNDTQEGTKAGRDIWIYNNTFYKINKVAFEYWNPKEKAKPDAEVVLLNNLAVSNEEKSFAKWAPQLNWKNNFESMPDSVLKDPNAMDFTPTIERLKNDGIPVLGKDIPYIGAVDPKVGMWRYGVDESKLPKP